MALSDAEKWDARYAGNDSPETDPIPFLRDNIGRLGSGSALDVACGCGRNAVFLAERGFDTTALDISEVGLGRCRRLAEQRGVTLQTVCADLDDHELGDRRFDLVTKIYFYVPRLFPSIRRALKPGGHLLFQTFSQQHADVGTFGPRNPAYLARRDEILEAFSDDHVVCCDEVVLTEDGDTEAVLQVIVRVV